MLKKPESSVVMAALIADADAPKLCAQAASIIIKKRSMGSVTDLPLGAVGDVLRGKPC